jgi:hypothetical protein
MMPLSRQEEFFVPEFSDELVSNATTELSSHPDLVTQPCANLEGDYSHHLNTRLVQNTGQVFEWLKTRWPILPFENRTQTVS